jgi:sugar/nucleoside kinase (ribokinase family)
VGRLGRPAGIIGCVGDDDFGWLNIDRLRRDGVDTSAIALLADAVTGSAFVTYTETGERHFTINIANSASASRRRRSLSRCSPIARGFTSFWACATAGEIKGQRTSVSERNASFLRQKLWFNAGTKWNTFGSERVQQANLRRNRPS